MAIFFDAPVSPIDLTTYVRNVPMPSVNLLSQMFPFVQTPTNVINIGELTQVNRTAKFRAYDARIPTLDRDSYVERTIKMLPLSAARNEGEYERLSRETMRLGGANRQAMEQALYNDATSLVNAAHNRIEVAIADTLADGIFAPPELAGLVADFQVPASNLITVGTPWAPGTGGGDPLADLLAASDLYETTNGFRPGFMITSRKVSRTLQSSTSLVNAIRGAQTGVTRVNQADIELLFGGLGIPTEIIPYESRYAVDGVSVRALPDNLVILGPPNPGDLLEVHMGVSATALELINGASDDFGYEAAPGLVCVVEKDGPPYRKFTYLDGLCMPVIKDPRKLMVLKVAA